ncbi:Mediator of RNA polymerase II transcription subunit 12 [Tolypocladium ophioglossoides CBS 100239]|uniref:Mediator of RNA polymerase II transcription subunit 12 n=1 Tax=Tolypocladium ophioglossoides (strain CBS 100239) TaxID=1163406 RepID=A0A0L0N232_TOLOC|nr:Mediator of RNA polymerase II transcription subunit 12 [Tolypocladium ophioglossoides CBS 100239]
MGVPPRQPQRGPSSTLAVQRPAHHQRSLSQQYLSTSTSPIRKDAHPDLTNEPVDAAQGRHHVSTPRRGGSKLRLELSNDLGNGPASATESPQVLTPSRMMPMSDATDMDTMSPALSRASQQEPDNVPMPMPRRRPQASQLPAGTLRTSTLAPAQVKKDSRPKPYTVEVPPAAPRFVSTNRHDAPNRDLFSKGLFSGHADFFPWSGRHHEDEWSHDAIGKGTWDRGSQNEAASARLAIPPLKQKSGLNALATIFMGVLNQRRHRGQITAPSTFKPPPRVTLTDTKREVWLKDLANPTISLRRLSRTIPHGIRGRTLLDQCLNKTVPTERAVWLAKCVGANEIRAFKRKGAGGAFVMGGESKWVRDWTVLVEQFVEAVVSAFGEADWKARVTYAIRLATSLYSEQLLDRDHYLDWIVCGLESSPQSRIPMWIVIAQITWVDLLRSRKYGRRLTYALLGHLHAIYNDPDRDVLIQLSSQISGLLKALIQRNPESFISPNLWPRYRDTLRASLPVDDGLSQGAYHKVDARNSRLLVANTTSGPAGRQDLVKLVDSAVQGQNGRHLAAKCWATLDDKSEIVKIAVEWATSVHRPGLAKIYIVARLIKSWSTFNINATQPILDVLSDIRPGDRRRSKCVFHLVAELVRSRLFSVPHYMQWLIGRGGLHDAADIDPNNGPCASRLLIELPVHCLPESQKAQRSNLLRRAGQYSTTDEAHDISNALRCVDDTLGLSPHLANSDAQTKCFPLRKLLRRVSNSSKAVQTAIGAHLGDVFTTELLGKVDSIIALSIFHSVRAMLETVDDFFMLSHILKVCSTASDVEVLAACVDTVNSHLEVFLALECADALFGLLIDRLKAVSSEQGVVARPLLAALSSLARRLPFQQEIAIQLVRELAQSDRSNAIDACSPVSDNMAMQTQGAEGEVSEQIDKLLASGNIIDHPTMNRLFRIIIPKLEAGWAKGDESRRVFSSLLTRLRIFDTQHFDKLMADWVSHIRTLMDRPPLLELFPLLVSLGCLSISTMLHTANAGTPAAEEAPLYPGVTPSGSAVYLQELLQLLITALPKSTSLDSDEIYRFEIQQKSARSEQPKGLLLMIRNALIEYSALRDRGPGRDFLLDDAAYEDRLLETLKYLVVADSTAVAHVLNIGNLPVGATALVHKIITKLLIPDDNGGLETSFDQILGLANELTMPFCQLKLNLDLSVPQRSSGAGEMDDDNPSRFEAFAKAMDRAIEARNIMWTGMLPCLSQDITRNLSNQAHARFLDLMPSLKSTSFEDDAISEHRIHLAENLLGVLEAINSGQLPSKSAQLTANLVEKLSDLLEIVASKDEERAQAQKEVLSHWLPVLLRFITLNSISPEPLQSSNPNQSNAARIPVPLNHEARARMIIVLCGLLLELDSQPQTTGGALSQEVFDIAVLLVDALPDDLRVQCARLILFMPGGAASTSTTSDPRLYYLFSVPQPTSAENLKLTHRDKASIPYSAAARGMSAMYGMGPASQERLTPFMLRRWEILSEPTPNVGENDTSLSLSLFEAIRTQ